jgi:hypothetical protein
MKYLSVLTIALLALPVVASAKSGCNVRDSNTGWTYYSVATGTSPYTISCALTVSNGTISSGQCASNDGTSLTATGTLTVASSGGSSGNSHRVPATTRTFMKKNPTVCTVTGSITYQEIGLTETLTNLTINHDRDLIVGVGNNGADLISVTFIANR